MKIALRIIVGLYLVVLLVIWGIVLRDTGDSWPVTLFLFSPRWVVALPLLVLWPLTIWKSPKFSLLYFVHGVVIVIPIMGATLGLSTDRREESMPTFRMLTCNLGEGELNRPKLISLVKFHQVDVVLLQECRTVVSDPLFEELGWNHRQAANLAIGSPYELSEIRVLTRQPKSKFSAIAGVACDIHWKPSVGTSEAGKWIQIVGVHFPTFRPAFERARKFDGGAEEAFLQLSERYNVIVDQTVQTSERYAEESGMSTLIAGDFNVPVDSDFYRRHWKTHQNALSLAGSGFNYTKYTRFHGIRIDHVLADSHWRVVSAQVGANLGGDHCPVIAELQCKSW
ncbi:endonuclease/exonuclease/phosphatase family protein [Aporhodopirellula aestuarii]|uniref:Endonuclease/exonuclease/phosphatase family protein n=1 Tax=Aporhodopirellula aestuarii TaxID=2950107 RepID=A0ABT0UES6_9BACT|nr:endonuclease/exonuclease/phosphatase family protein [Aporhodopirellula aestuarii]MCM2374828.1 endonuclease/exonuclease/phosphatase family protein [Aporhodopirellula aestuarii]